MNGAAWTATLARRTIDALFRVDNVMTAALGSSDGARRALVSTGGARGTCFCFDDIGHDRE